MPKLTYRQGEESTVFDISFGKIMSPERIAIERLTGITSWDEVQNQFWANSTTVIAAFLYVLLKRENPTLNPAEVMFCDDDYDLEPNDAEALLFLRAAEATDEAKNDPEIRADLAKVRAELEAKQAAGPKEEPATSESETST